MLRHIRIRRARRLEARSAHTVEGRARAGARRGGMAFILAHDGIACTTRLGSDRRGDDGDYLHWWLDDGWFFGWCYGTAFVVGAATSGLLGCFPRIAVLFVEYT